MDDRRTSAAESFTMFVNCTANIPNWLNKMGKLIDGKETSLTEWVIQQQQYEAELKQRCEARKTEREECAAAITAIKATESEKRQRQHRTTADSKRRQLTIETLEVTQVNGVQNAANLIAETLTTVENNGADNGSLKIPPLVRNLDRNLPRAPYLPAQTS